MGWCLFFQSENDLVVADILQTTVHVDSTNWYRAIKVDSSFRLMEYHFSDTPVAYKVTVDSFFFNKRPRKKNASDSFRFFHHL